MAHLTHKTTILLSESDYQLLTREAKATNKTMGELIRRAIGKVYRQLGERSAGKAWNKLFKAEAPVSNWDTMEKEILKSRLT